MCFILSAKIRHYFLLRKLSKLFLLSLHSKTKFSVPSLDSLSLSGGWIGSVSLRKSPDMKNCCKVAFRGL